MRLTTQVLTKKMLQWGNIKDTRKTTGKHTIPMENRPFTNLYTQKKMVMFRSYGRVSPKKKDSSLRTMVN